MALNKTKTDKILGQEVRNFLIKKGVETPLKKDIYENDAIEIKTIEIKKSIEKHFQSIMELMGLNLEDDSLIKTPQRVAKMYIDEVFWGLGLENFPKITTVENKMKYDEMIIEKDISIKSNCEHHFVPIIGKCHIAYIPNKKVLGLSKLNRVAEYFARRPQIQERLTEQIYFALSYILDTENIAVVIEANHMCVQTRGVEDTNSRTLTSKMGGVFYEKTSPARQEFLSLIRK